MMTKTKSNAAWNELTAEQRARLEGWLFDENMSYAKALERARAELGFTGSSGSLHRFYHRMALERRLREAALADTTGNEEESRRAGMRAVGRLFVQQVTENPEGIRDWAVLARMLLQSEANGLRRTLEAERHELQRESLDLKREKYEFSAAEAVMNQLDNREDLDAEELAREKARVLAIRERLYGRKLTQEEIERGQPQ